MQEFLTISQLAKGFSVSEKVIRHAFKKLLRQGKISEGDDFIREGYQDAFNFTYRIHPGKFAALSKLFPVDAPLHRFDTHPATTGNQFATTPDEFDSKSDSRESDSATNTGSQQNGGGSNSADTATTTADKESPQGIIRDDFLLEYLESKNEQILLLKEQVGDLRRQLDKKDEQIGFLDQLLQDFRLDQNDARSLLSLFGNQIAELSKLALPAATNNGSRGSNMGSNDNRSDTNVGSTPDDFGTNRGSQEDEGGSNSAATGNPWQQNAPGESHAKLLGHVAKVWDNANSMQEDEIQKNTEPTVILQDEGLRKLKGFVQIPKFILMHKKISLGAKVAYGVLLGYAWQDGFCFPAQTSLANDLGLQERQVRNLLNELEKNGLIDWRQQGVMKPNIYTLLPINTFEGNSDRQNIAGHDRQYLSTPDRQNIADYKYPNGNTHKTVNGLGILLKKLPPIEQSEEETEYIAESILEELGIEDAHSRKFHHLVASRIPERTIRKHLAEIRSDGARNPAALFTHRIKKTIEERAAEAYKDNLAALRKRLTDGKRVQ